MPKPLRPASLPLAIVLFLASACGDDGGPTGPVAGTLQVNLTTPHADDAAIALRIVGPGIGQVSASDPGAYLHVVQAGSTTTAVLVGDFSTGGVIRFSVPDVGVPEAYAATILEVADRSNALRASLTGYGLSVSEIGG